VQANGNPESGNTGKSKTDAPDHARGPSAEISGELSQPEQKKLEQLKHADRSVHSHELAHISAGGGYVRGGARFQYQKGPDGNRYAVAGEVSIDSSPIPGDPKATAEKMDKIRAAALAPSNPSNQDRRVANMANRIKAEALMELSLLQARSGEQNNRESADVLSSAAAMSYEKGNDDYRIGSSVDLVT